MLKCDEYLIIMPKKVLTKSNVKNIENNFSHTLRKEGKQKKKTKKTKPLVLFSKLYWSTKIIRQAKKERGQRWASRDINIYQTNLNFTRPKTHGI